MYKIEINNRVFTVSGSELTSIRAKGVKVNFIL